MTEQQAIEATERGIVLAATALTLEQQITDLTMIASALRSIDVPAAELVSAVLEKTRIAAGYITNKYGSEQPAV